MISTDVVLDANLLVLLVVGMASPSYIARHRRLREYTAEDFLLLKAMLGPVRRVVVTPNVLTEASNLLRQTPEPIRSEAGEVFRRLIAGLDETYIPSRTAIGRDEFMALGLADAASLETNSTENTLLTVDFDLYWRALHAGQRAENFTHHREAAGLI